MSVLRLNEIKHYQGNLNERPPQLQVGDYYFAIDEGTLYRFGSDNDYSAVSFDAELDSKEIGKRLLGWQDFADTATTVTPIVQSNVNGGEVQLTNNNADTLTDGTTNVNAETTVDGVNDLWSTVSNTLVFSGTGIEKNDVINLRVHLKVLSSIIEQAFDVRLEFYDQIDGQGNIVFTLRKQMHVETLSAGVFREKMVDHSFFVGESILNGSCKIILEGTKSFEVETIGWNLLITKIAR